MYESQTENAIRQRMLAAISDTLDKREGSFIYDAVAPTALEIMGVYQSLDQVLDMAFVKTTYGVYLDRKAAEWGITRKPAVKATGNLMLAGTAGAVIYKGTMVSTAVGLKFFTTHDVAIDEDGIASVRIEAESVGTSGNVPASVIVEIPIGVAGLQSVINPESTSGGADTETDEELRARVLECIAKPATSGNIHHYRQWAMSVPGIGDAKVIPTWDGPGTVKVVLLDTNKLPANPELITAVTTYIEANRPIGALVTVVAAEPVIIDIAVTVAYDAGGYTLEQITNAVETVITNYLCSIAFTLGYVSYAKVGSLIMSVPGVMDHSALQINLGTANVNIGDTQVAVLGAVTLSE